jgi:hypothetical protein
MQRGFTLGVSILGLTNVVMFIVKKMHLYQKAMHYK